MAAPASWRTFLQNPPGNPLAGKPVLQWFPSFGPAQFAVAGSPGHTALWGHLALGLAWPAAFAAAGLLIFRARTRTRHDCRATGLMSARRHAMSKHAPG
jgi:ABC-2 type transport system permease protein